MSLLDLYIRNIDRIALSYAPTYPILGSTKDEIPMWIDNNVLTIGDTSGDVHTTGVAEVFLLLSDRFGLIDWGQLYVGMEVHQGLAFTLSQFEIRLDGSSKDSSTQMMRLPLANVQYCHHCGTRSHESFYHPGTCGNCGARYDQDYR